MACRGAMRIASCFIGLALAEIWRTAARRLCVLLSQADSERALLGRIHNLVFARQPTDGPVEERSFCFHLVLQLCERQFALGTERLPNCPCSLADFFSRCDSFSLAQSSQCEYARHLLSGMASTK